MTVTAWAPAGRFEEPEQMGDGIVLENVDMESLGEGFAPFKMSRFSVPPGCGTGNDQHAARELWIIREGEGVLSYDGTEFEVRKGGIYLFEENRPHSIQNSGTQVLHIFSLWWAK